MNDIMDAMALGPREHLALVGGGGKTTLLFALSEACLRAERRVLLTTTTKVWFKQARKAPRVFLQKREPSWREELRNSLVRKEPAFLAEDLLENGKVQGIDPDLADELFMSGEPDYLLNEADGAAGRPLKAPGPYEPVIPRSVTKVVALMGLEALEKPFSTETVFREDLFAEITGCAPGQRLSIPILAGFFSHPRGLFKNSPEAADRIVFLNKSDLLTDLAQARELARRILLQAQGSLGRVVIGSVATNQYSVTEG